jgi:predicted house-cleaning noncanonical NTP pyrophosphatase (MazG superfamily)
MKLKKFAVQKLIRDKMPEILAQRNIALDFHIMDHDHHLKGLKDKLIEEAHEVADAQTKIELIEELADLQEVIDALLAFQGISKENLAQIQHAKRNHRGGFNKGVYSTSIEMAEDNPYIEYYLAKPQEYPEITD